MQCPCKGCDLRKVGCHDKCPKEPSYADWKQWSNEVAETGKAAREYQSEYLRHLKFITKIKRRKH